jgi:hypothetical protein
MATVAIGASHQADAIASSANAAARMNPPPIASHGAIFAEAVADRADDELDRAVGDRVGGDDYGRGADAGVKIGRDLRQQRIGHPHLRLAGKAGHGKQHDGACRRFFALGRVRLFGG